MALLLFALLAAGPAVLQHHHDARRAGFYVAPALTTAWARSLREDASFDGRFEGHVYAQPLLADGVLFVATENNTIVALDAATGKPRWRKQFGTPVPEGAVDCGNIHPLGITGTPIIESATLYFDAADFSGDAVHHRVYGISTKDGATLPGFPIDVAASIAGFNAKYANQRGALAVLNGILYVPYGGHYGDCGDYKGWVVGIPLDRPQAARGWSVPGREGGIWSPVGVASDGRHLFVATGNTDTQRGQPWAGGEAILRLAPGPALDAGPANFFAPADWQELDDRDADLGGSGVVLAKLGDLTAALAFGKDGKAYVADAENLGGIGGALAAVKVASGQIITAPAVMPLGGAALALIAARGSACPGDANGLVALDLKRAGARVEVKTRWCAKQDGKGSPLFTAATSAGADALAWSLGAEGDGRLRAFDARTGRLVAEVPVKLDDLRRFQTPIVAGDCIFVAADGRVHALAPAR